MGRILKGGDMQSVRVSTRRPGSDACGPEILSFLACMDAHGGDDIACKAAKNALARCMQSAVVRTGATKHKPTLNFHLQKVRHAQTVHFRVSLRCDGCAASPAVRQGLQEVAHAGHPIADSHRGDVADGLYILIEMPALS